MKHKLLAVALAALALTVMNSCTSNTNTADAVFENIFNRKSVRSFTSEPVSQEHIEAGTTKPRDKWKPENVHYGRW